MTAKNQEAAILSTTAYDVIMYSDDRERHRYNNYDDLKSTVCLNNWKGITKHKSVNGGANAFLGDRMSLSFILTLRAGNMNSNPLLFRLYMHMIKTVCSVCFIDMALLTEKAVIQHPESLAFTHQLCLP